MSFFVDKLTKLSCNLQRELERSTFVRFINACDQAYFKTGFFSYDRPGDLGKVKVPEILRFPNNDSFLFNHVWGKTMRGYPFCPTTPTGGIQDSPFTSAAAEARLKVYLKKMGADNGETLRGFRSGCAITSQECNCLRLWIMLAVRIATLPSIPCS